MTDTAMPPEAPNAAETAHFLRRFANLMSNGQNAQYLLRGAALLDVLTARLAAASDEEQLSRYRYETLSQQNDALEAECQRLKDDIEGHVNVAGLILSERDTLKAALEAREAELRDFGVALQLEKDRQVTQSQAHEAALDELRAAFDQERISLRATAEVSSKEVDQVRRVFDREREEMLAHLKAREDELFDLRRAVDRERDEFQSQLKSREDEIAELRAGSGREQEALMARIGVLETKRAELRSAFDRINQLRDPAAPVSDLSIPDLRMAPQSHSAIDQASAVVPKETLRQARAQFEFLAKECIRRGDVATQAMCELGAHTMDLALSAEEDADALPVGEMALSILGPPGLALPVARNSRGAVG